MSAKGSEATGDQAGTVAEAAIDAEEEEASELASGDALVRSARADAERTADQAANEEETDHRLRATTREGVDLLVTETATRKVAAEETMIKEEEEADPAMAAEELTSMARDREPEDREVAEEAAPAAQVQDQEAREVAVPELVPLSPSERSRPAHG